MPDIDMDFADGAQIKSNKWGLLSADPVTLATSIPGVFAGGDVVAALLVLAQVPPNGRMCFRAGRAYWQPS